MAKTKPSKPVFEPTPEQYEALGCERWGDTWLHPHGDEVLAAIILAIREGGLSLETAIADAKARAKQRSRFVAALTEREDHFTLD